MAFWNRKESTEAKPASIDSKFKFPRFLTSAVINFFAAGCLLLLLSQIDKFFEFFQPWVGVPLKGTLKLVGGALVGSGVFTAIIKSKSYTEIFSNAIGEIVWSDKFIAQRDDKIRIWSRVSKLIYNDKFPKITDEIEEIIMSKYFPTKHEYYIEDYDLIINVTDHNEHFWKQTETVSMTIVPSSDKIEFTHRWASSIILPPAGIDDATSFSMRKLVVNGENDVSPIADAVPGDGLLNHEFYLTMNKKNQYIISLEREKIICKKTNPEKKMFVVSIVNNMKITVITGAGINIDFHSSGTIKEFVSSPPQVNADTKISVWTYKGLILPNQGYIMIFK